MTKLPVTQAWGGGFFLWAHGLVTCFWRRGDMDYIGETAPMPDWFPAEVTVAPGLRAAVIVSATPPERFGNVADGVGCLSIVAGEVGTPDVAIWVSEHLCHVDRHQVLLHELMHAADIARRQSGEYTARPSEQGYVRPMNHRILSDISRSLLPVLVESGLWFGVSRDTLRRYLAEGEENHEPARPPARSDRAG